MICRKPFWRELGFDAFELSLIEALEEAHSISAVRNSVSSVTVANAAAGSGDFVKSVASAMLTLGDLHGPIEQAYAVLKNGRIELPLEGKIPGWGNSFVKGKPDPSWSKVHDLLMTLPIGQVIMLITHQLSKAKGKEIFPNPACYTASVAIVIGMPPRVSSYFFVAARIEQWGRIFLHNTPSPRLKG